MKINEERLNRRNKVARTPKYWIRLTWLCNNNCIFCLDKEAQNGTYVPWKAINNQLKQGRRQGFKKLILSGGEPTLHPDYLKIVKISRDIGYDGIQTITNGRLFIYKDFLERAVTNGLTETTFSIHGHTKELYERQSQIKGSYEQAMRGLLNALENKDLIVNMDIVINRINYRYLEEIIRFFINLGVSEFDLLQVVPFGNAWKNRKELFYDVKMALPFLKKAFSLQSEYPHIYLWTNRFPARYLEGFEHLIQHPVKLYDEINGRKEVFEEFLKEGKIMNCWGERCHYCFLHNFCQDLLEFYQTNKLTGRCIPYCLTKNNGIQNTVFILENKNNLDIFKFLEFFIKYRYFIKGLNCNMCRFNKSCEGIPCAYVRKYGFSAPI